MTDSPDEIAKRENAAEIIGEIWRRARINAFAHKFAHEDAKKRSLSSRKKIVFSSLGSIVAIIIVYLVLVNSGTLGVSEQWASSVGLLFTAVSVFLTIRSLYLDAIASEENWRVVAAEHEFLLGSYQYIAQRAREAKWPDRPMAELVELLRDLERDFQLLKARGKEPEDTHFQQAHGTFKEVRKDPVSRSAQSFAPDSPEDVGHEDVSQITDSETDSESREGKYYETTTMTRREKVLAFFRLNRT